MKKARRTENVPIRIKDFLAEYNYNDDIFCPDSEKGRRLKKIVSELPDVDRIVFLLYTELQSYTEISRILGISRSTAWWEVKRIREKILEEYDKIQSIHSHLS